MGYLPIKLIRAIEYIERIEQLDSDTQLSLTIVGDDGQGLSLLLSNHITLDEIKEVVRNHQDNKGRERTPT